MTDQTKPVSVAMLTMAERAFAQRDAAVSERDAMLAFIKQLSDALLTVRPLGGSELFVNRFGAYYADPVYCQAMILKLRTDLNDAHKEKVRAQRDARSPQATVAENAK